MLAAIEHRSTPDYVKSVILDHCFPGEEAKDVETAKARPQLNKGRVDGHGPLPKIPPPKRPRPRRPGAGFYAEPVGTNVTMTEEPDGLRLSGTCLHPKAQWVKNKWFTTCGICGTKIR